MVGWHHRLKAHEFEQTPGDVKDRKAWLAEVCGVAKSQTRLSDRTTKTSENNVKCRWGCLKNTTLVRVSAKERLSRLWPIAAISHESLVA